MVVTWQPYRSAAWMREATPAGADLEQTIVGLEIEEHREPVELRDRRVGERRVRRLEHGARVRHGLVEHTSEEVVAEVIVRPDVAGVALRAHGTKARDRIDHRAHEPVEAVPPCVRGAQPPQRETEEAGQVVGLPPAVGVGLTEADAALTNDPLVRPGVQHVDPHVQRRRPVHRIQVPERGAPGPVGQGDCAASQPCEQPADDRSCRTVPP